MPSFFDYRNYTSGCLTNADMEKSLRRESSYNMSHIRTEVRIIREKAEQLKAIIDDLDDRVNRYG